MSAIILPFIRPLPASLDIAQAERAQAAAWAARLAASWGGSWWVETHISDDGEAWLGVVTPSSSGVRVDDLTLAWLVSRTTEGIALMHMPSGKRAGLFRTLPEALAVIEHTERNPRTVAYGRS
ncbi:MAG TPA: hypothetical protein VIL69_18125 [Roseomonas sp.]